MNTRVLIAPAGKSISKSKYAKEYYLLKNTAQATSSINMEAYCKKTGDTPNDPNLSIDTICKFDSYYAYYLCSFNFARKKLKQGDYNIYHHLNFHYRFHNLLVAADLIQDIPTVIGPTQPPHTVPDSRKRKYLNRNSPVDLSEKTLYKLVPAVNLAESAVNVPREFLFRKTLENVDRLVAVNEETAELYAEYMPRSNIEVIPIGVALNRFERATPSKSEDILSVGNLHYRKGFDVLLNAWSGIAGEYPNATLHILGDGAERENLESQAKNLNISESVVFHGHVDHSVVVEKLASVRAFVHPTRSEGYPHVRLEAMASGLPVIGTNITGAREMIRDGIDGVIVPVENSKAIASGISNLLSNPTEADRMGENARDHVEEKFDWVQIGKRYANLYNQLSQ